MSQLIPIVDYDHALEGKPLRYLIGADVSQWPLVEVDVPMTEPATATVTGANILAFAQSCIGKFVDGPDVVTLATAVAMVFPDLAAYCREATNTMPWCGDFAAYVMAHFGIRPPGPDGNDVGFFYVDRWKDFGTVVPVGQEQPGDVAIFIYPGVLHHVTFVAGGGYYIGGNQSDAVTKTKFGATPSAIRRAPLVGAVVTPPPPPPSTGAFPNSGKGSWYSQFSGKYEWVDDGDTPGSAALGVPDDAQGISFYDHSTLGKWFEVLYPNGFVSIEQQTDIGPHPTTGRTIDISAAAAERAGYSPDNIRKSPNPYPTDAIVRWRAIDPPASVAGLSLIQQGIRFRDLRSAPPKPVDPVILPPDPKPEKPMPDPTTVDAAMAQIRPILVSLATSQPPSKEDIRKYLLGILGEQPSVPLLPAPPAPVTPAPVVTPPNPSGTRTDIAIGAAGLGGVLAAWLNGILSDPQALTTAIGAIVAAVKGRDILKATGGAIQAGAAKIATPPPPSS